MDQLVTNNRTYNPAHLFDIIGEKFKIKTDVQMGMFLGIGNPSICKIRHRIQPISGSLLIRIHEITGLSIPELKDMMGDRRTKQRASKNKLIDGRSNRILEGAPPQVFAAGRN